MEELLLAVAVHEKGEARLEPALDDELHVEAGKPFSMRVSYALYDHADAKEDAKVAALLTMEGRPPIFAEVRMRDRPMLDDTQLGDLVFDLPALEPGEHHIHYAVALETHDQDLLLRDPEAAKLSLKGDLTLHAA